MNIKKSFTIFALTLFCTGCIFTPITDTNQPYARNCDMLTKKLTLDEPKSERAFSCQKNMRGGDILGCLILAGIIIPAGSLVISGSIVLINNSLHWLEYQGSCDKKQIEENEPSFINTLVKSQLIAKDSNIGQVSV
ncbi:MAG: hypothetical protein HRT35_00520 [Algicola sp.]|nr:hypothetical protein [Algicola sp.]